MKTIQMLWTCALMSLAVSPVFAQQDRLLVAEKGEMRLSIFDPAGGILLGAVPEGGTTGHEVVASPDGKLAYVPIYGNSGVGKPGTDGSNMVVIDLATAKVVGNVDFGHGVRPHCPVFGPVDGLLYVTTELDKTVTIIDPKTLKIVGTIPTGQAESHMLALSRDGRFGYTANVGPGTVSVLDMIGRKTIKVIPIAATTQRISISTDDRWVFTSDQVKPELAVIDLKTMTVARTVDVASDPQEVVVSPDGNTAFISCQSGGEVVGIDLVNWRLSKAIETGKQPDGLAWAAAK